MKTDVVIIGAGASGLICGIEAARRGRSVIIIDHTSKTGSKIRVSGGGKCNFTNKSISHERYISSNPHFCKSALSRYTPDNFMEMLNRHSIHFSEKDGGRIFCNRSSSDLIRALEAESRNAGVRFRLSCRVKSISKKGFFLVFTDRERFESDSLVIATGGLSYPKLGATDLGLRVAKNFGLNIIQTRPGLVPLTLCKHDIDIFKDLSGVSMQASVKCQNKSFSGGILFTHRGVSGPAILQISSYWTTGKIISVNLLPEIDAVKLLHANRSSRKQIHNFLSQYLPSRFISIWCRHYIKTQPLYRFTEKELKSAAELLSNWEIKPSGTEGYKSAEVTVGGIDTNELSSKTMEAKKIPGLYFVGEVIDVTGQLGGYNLHWAWASGHAAGQFV